MEKCKSCLFYCYAFLGHLTSLLLQFSVMSEWIGQCTWEQSGLVAEEYEIFTDRIFMAGIFVTKVVSVAPVCVLYWRKRLQMVRMGWENGYEEKAQKTV